MNLCLHEGLPALLRDPLAARRPHGVEDLEQQRICKALHLYKIDNVLHVGQQLPTLLVLVGLALDRRQKGGAGGDRLQLIEISAEDLRRHTTPRLLWLHVLCGVEAVA